MKYIELSKAELPPVYKRNGKKCYLDPIRKKLIYVTPEETIRQKVISFLIKDLKVPKRMLTVEEPLSDYGIKTRDRADIIISAESEEHQLIPIAVVECKAENVALDERGFSQAYRYSDALGCQYVLFINGVQYFCMKYDDQKKDYIRIQTLPGYHEMLNGEYLEEPIEPVPERISLDQIESCLKEERANPDYVSADISESTPLELAVPLFNLWDGLLDYRVKFPVRDYGMFRLIEDYGVRMLSYGNGSGGHFFGPYRSFLVDVNGNTEFYSIGCSVYNTQKSIDNNLGPKTCICVAHDDEKVSHHALQLVAEDNIVSIGKKLKFYHHGKIAVGRIGSGKKAELMSLVEKRYPKIIDGSRYYLGEVTADHLLRLDEPDVINLVVNMISYSIVRDEYRSMVKADKSHMQ